MSPVHTTAALRQSLREALDQHTSAIESLSGIVALLETAQAVQRHEAEEALDRVLQNGRVLREYLEQARARISEPAPDSSPRDLEELTKQVTQVLKELDNLVRDVPRRRLEALVEQLRRGRFNEASWKARKLENHRRDAILEIDEALRAPELPADDFPGPAFVQDPWLEWFWSLDASDQDGVATKLEEDWPKLLGFLAAIPETAWVSGGNGEGAAVSHYEPRGTTDDEPRGSTDLDASPQQGEGDPAPSMELDPGDESSASPDDPQGQEADPSETEAPPVQPATEPRDGAPLVDTPKETMHETTPGDPKLPTSVLIEAAATICPTPTVMASPRTSQPDSPTPRSSRATSATDTTAGPGVSDDAPVEDTTESSVATPDPASLEPHSSDDPLPEAMPFEQYKVSYWLDMNAVETRAPWLEDGFSERLVQVQRQALLEWDQATATLIAEASITLDINEAASRSVVDQIFAFAQGYSLDSAEPVEDVVGRLDEAIQDARVLSEAPSDWLTVCLLLLDHPEAGLDSNRVPQLCELMELDGPGGSLLRQWWRLNSREGRGGAATRLREQLTDAPPSIDDLRRDVDEKARRLGDDLTRNYKAAGGKIPRTHCREAWDAFMSEAHPELRGIAKHHGHGVELRHLDRLADRARKLFDRAGARYQDRAKMDKVVDQLLADARAVLAASQALRRAKEPDRKSKRANRFDETTVQELKCLLESQASRKQGAEAPASLDSWVLSLVLYHLRLLDVSTIGKGPVFGQQDLLRHPMLVEGWTHWSPTDVELDVRQVNHPVQAVARLLEDPLDPPADDLETWLVSRRPDLLTGCDDLRGDTVKALDHHKRDRDEQLHTLGAKLRTVELELGQLADVQHDLARDAVDLLDRSSEEPLSTVQQAWLMYCERVLANRRDKLVAHLVAQARQGGTDEDELTGIVESRQLGALLRILGHQRPANGGQRVRATLLRRDAETRWRSPGRLLSQAEDDDLVEERAKPVLKVWGTHRRTLRRRKLDRNEAAELRDSFVEFILQRTKRARTSKVRTYTPRGGVTHYHQVDIPDLRSWLVADVGNPTFLPQLERFRTLSIKVVPVSVRAPYLARKIHSEAHNNEITIILAPGLESEQRDQVRQHLANNPYLAPIAILDDLDLCRILNPGDEPPDPLLATLEIMAEQQPWSRFCPYEVVEGQHVRLEMFVGRQKEAEQLAKQANYGRIFSGRRLGKTALLRFVEGSPDLKQLPSGNSLRVMFCSIAGMESETEVAQVITDTILGALQLSELDIPPDLDPVERLKKVLPAALEARPQTSLLVLLDEADTFFDSQVSSRESARQQSLSWWMSRHAEKLRDRANLPRVRFVFCGYLHTDQNRGVWENKGDVLLLRPLDVDDAVQLVVGPLARIGIDAAAQADNIAFRCGYQPAVIIRFGLELINHLEKTRAIQERGDGVKVEARDVLAVFQMGPVQNAIREACWLNFVGHPVGQLVFAAMLMELRGRAPAAAVEEVPERILAQIREVYPSFNPASIYEGTWAGLVFQQIRSLVDRSLLVPVAHQPAAYRLRFPHHLPVLLQEDPAQRLRDAIDRLRSGHLNRKADWLVSEPVMEAIRFSLGPDGKNLGLKAVVVGSHWLAPLEDPESGLATRLGLVEPDGQRVVRTGDDAMEAIEAKDYHHGQHPLLLMGGMELARHAQRRETLDGDVELAKTGRLVSKQVFTWLQRKRAAEFTANDAINRIMRRTGGIPILVATLDELLVEKFNEAPTLDTDDLQRLLDSLDEAIPAVRHRLRQGPDPLTEREIELVDMVARACLDYGEDFAEAMQDNLVDYGEQTSPLPYGPEDGSSIRVLLTIGLLSRSTTGMGSPLEQVGVLDRNDPVLTLLGLGSG